MGNLEIDSYFNREDSISYLLRTLSAPSQNKNNTLLDKIATFGMDIAMIVAPLITYFFQINKFNKTKSSKGFSKLICFLLFMGNILRIFFWFGTHFKRTLLYQSTGIVIFQVILIHLCVKYQERPIQKQFLQESTFNDNKGQENNSSGKSVLYYLLHWKETFNIKKIWKWEIEIEYYKFMFFIIFVIFSLMEILQKYKIFFHIIGSLSAIFESLTCVPQVIENYKTKNSQNVSFTMIFCWFLGDSFRLYYNIKYKAPIQMITAISVQVTLDIIVCIQLIMYRDFGKKSPINTAKKKIEDINKLMKKIDEINIFEKKKEGNQLEQIEIKKNNSGEENEGEKNEQKLDHTNNSDPDTTLK